MDNPIDIILKNKKVMILDGAMATELEKHGCDIDDELWSAKILAEKPELIQKVHYDYFAAGADCAITASYQATMEGFIKKGFSKDKAIELIKKSVKLAKNARESFWKENGKDGNRRYPLVAASVGPYGAYLADGSEYRGDYKLSQQELMDFHRRRMALLLEEEPDLLACETIPSFLEAKALAELVKEFKAAYAWISFTAKNDFEISDGTKISECARLLNEYDNIAAIGVNCTSPKYIPNLIDEIKKNSSKPIIVYPNSGEEYDVNEEKWGGHTCCSTYGSDAKIWYDHGARLIGGCCRTSPEHIKAVVQSLEMME